MEFCPTCANLLQYEMHNPARFFCRACPYVSPIERKVKIKRGVQLAIKEPSPVAAGEENNVVDTRPVTDASCPKCQHGRAWYEQFQTRSADEPMTIFYECMNDSCRHKWRED